MTPQEHELITRMLAKQFSYIELLVRILQSREIIEGGDLSAFLALVRSDTKREADALLSVQGEYQQAAKDIGLVVRFPAASS